MKRKKVAVFVSNMYGHMIRDMQEGLNEAALAENVKLIYFVSFSDEFSKEVYDKYVQYDEGDIVSFKLPDLNDFDGIVILAASFSEHFKERLDIILSKTNIPIIYLGGVNKNYYNLLNDEERTYSEVIEHVIEKHGCRNLYHVAGKRDQHFTYERIDSFKNVLTKYGLKCDDDRIYFGTLWRDCGEPALDYILNHCKQEGCQYPDAIICANDYTAIGVVDACKKRGIRVPEDIIVTGYDGIENAKMGYPSITTSEQPFFGVGKNSIYVLKRIWNGEKVDQTLRYNGVLHLNQSCGCVPKSADANEDIRNVYSNRMGKMEYLAQSMTNMILSVSNSQNLEEVFRDIERNAKSDTGFKDFLLCLTSDWDKQKVITDDTELGDTDMNVICGFIGDTYVEPQTFKRKDLLPKELLDDPKPYYICSIHHLQYFMGYIIISPTLYSYNQLMAKSWLVNLGAMLENRRIRQELNDTVDRLEKLYNRDMLTGLYNRRGYELFFEDIYNECLTNRQKLAVMIIDMDDLKYVNDNYGHHEGDYSLCTISESMMVAAKNGELCIRAGGDEFVMLAGNYSEEKANEYIKQLRENIERRITRDNKPYKVDVSIGTYMNIPKNNNSSINEISESYLKQADSEMYKEKKDHKNKALQ